MKLLLLSLSLLGISSQAFAGFQGGWKGEAILNGVSCETSEIIICQRAAHFTIMKNFSHCGNREMDHDPIRTTIEDGKLMAEGQQVGTISDNTFSLFSSLSGYSAKIDAIMNSEMKTMHFSETISFGEIPIMELKGSYQINPQSTAVCFNIEAP